MYQATKLIMCIFFFTLAFESHAAFTCPPMPAALTNVNRDIRSDISASIGSLGKVKAGEIAVKTEIEAKNLFGKYPNVDKLLALQTMSATYCEMLKNTTAMPEMEKIARWEKFQDKVLDIRANPPNTSNTKRIAKRIEKKPEVKSSATIIVPASSFVRGNRVALASGEVARYGADVLLNERPYKSGPNSADFEFRVEVGGPYRFEAEYASAVSRPLKATLNQVIISNNVLGSQTSCFDPQCQKWMQQGEVHLRAGLNVLRLETEDVFPHIRALRFVPVQWLFHRNAGRDLTQKIHALALQYKLYASTTADAERLSGTN